MKATSMLVATALAIGLTSSASRGGEGKKETPRPPELKILDSLVGHWKDDMTFLPAVLNPKEKSMTAFYTNDWVLDRRFLWSEGRDTDGKALDMQLMSYDPAKKQFRRWFFGAEGHTSESTGQWLEDSKTFLWKGALEGGLTGTSKWRFLDKDTLDWGRILKDDDGKVFSNIHGKAMRQKPPADKPKKVRPEPKTPELKVLAQYLGTWNTETVAKAEGAPKEARTTGIATNEWVLDGTFIAQKSKESSGLENLQIRTYDPDRKQYRLWHFDSRGGSLTANGKWDADADTMTWKANLGNGITAVNAVRLGGDKLDWNLQVRDADGKVLVDMQGKSTRRK